MLVKCGGLFRSIWLHSGLDVLTEIISAGCSALLASIVIPRLLSCLSCMYAFLHVFVLVGVMSPMGLIITPKCLVYTSFDVVVSWVSLFVVLLHVSCVFIVACVGYMCVYDHAML